MTIFRSRNKVNTYFKKFTKSLAVAGLLFLSCFISASLLASPTEAWWMNITFDKASCNLSLNKLESNDSACYSLLSKESFREADTYYLNDIKALNFTFKLEVDLNSDDKPEYLAVGVYKGENSQGRFLVISKDSNFQEVIKIFKKESRAGFSALHQSSSEVNWYSCLYCNDKETLIFYQGNFYLE